MITVKLQKKKTHFAHFPRPGENDPYEPESIHIPHHGNENPIQAATIVWNQLMMIPEEMVSHSSKKDKEEGKFKDKHEKQRQRQKRPDKDDLPLQPKDRPTFHCPLQVQPVTTIWE